MALPMFFYDTTRPAPCQPASLDWRADPYRCGIGPTVERVISPSDVEDEDVFGGDVDEFDCPF